MLQAHPYEEPAYDVYTIENQSKEFGLGRVGVLDKPVRLNKKMSGLYPFLNQKRIPTHFVLNKK